MAVYELVRMGGSKAATEKGGGKMILEKQRPELMSNVEHRKIPSSTFYRVQDHLEVATDYRLARILLGEITGRWRGWGTLYET